MGEVACLNIGQNGFTTKSGCFNTITLLNEVVRYAKANRGITIVQIDITKASDSLSHDTILTTLREKGYPGEVIHMIRESYVGINTTIRCNPEIKMNIIRGVKQGDPLSPLLFNLCLDKVINKLQEMKGFQLPNSECLSCMAFADDILLFAETKPKASDLLDN